MPGNSHGRRSLVGCSPWGQEESDTTERLHFHFLLSRIGEGNGNPLQYSSLENPRDGGAWWAAIYGVAQSQTRLKWLSSSSSSKRNIWLPKPPSKFTHILLSCHRVRCPPTLPPWENTAELASGTWRFMKTLGCYPYYYQVHFYFLNKSLTQDLRVIVN